MVDFFLSLTLLLFPKKKPDLSIRLFLLGGFYF